MFQCERASWNSMLNFSQALSTPWQCTFSSIVDGDDDDDDNDEVHHHFQHHSALERYDSSLPVVAVQLWW